jgi:hypothetical protein
MKLKQLLLANLIIGLLGGTINSVATFITDRPDPQLWLAIYLSVLAVFIKTAEL